MKRYDEYYDQHQVKAVEILEELVISFMGNKQLQEAEKIVSKVSRMKSDSHVLEFFKRSRTTTREQDEASQIDGKMEQQKLCHSKHFLSLEASAKETCSI